MHVHRLCCGTHDWVQAGTCDARGSIGRVHTHTVKWLASLAQAERPAVGTAAVVAPAGGPFSVRQLLISRPDPLTKKTPTGSVRLFRR